MKGSIIPISKVPPVLARHSIAPPVWSDKPDEPIGFLCFMLGEEEYGVDLNLISQIVKPPALTNVPRAKTHVLGVVSIRGMVVTLVDLRPLMGLASTSWPRTARILIVEIEEEQIGLLVDGVTQVRRIPPSALEKNPSLAEAPKSDHVFCIARPAPGEIVIIVDLDAIITEKLG